MKGKFNITASASGNKATINITDVISRGSSTASSQSIRQLVASLLANGINEANVYLNSEGGSTFEATEIVNELNRIGTVKIMVGALAASAATYICSKFHTTAKPNSRFMIHKPSMENRGNEDVVGNNLRMLKDITSEYRKAYAKKTGKSESEIEAMWSKGDIWMTAQEALENRFIDAIEGNGSPSAKFTAKTTDIRSNWTVEDYIENDPEALNVMAQNEPEKFKRLNHDYFGCSQPTEKQPIQPSASWTIDDYIENDPEALKVMSQNEPERFKRLNDEYFRGK